MQTNIIEFSLRMVCRTCMCEDGVVSSIFDTKIEHENNIYSLADMLISCTNIQIQERDHLTEYICEKCQQQLSTAFLFKKQSERVDSILRKIEKNTNDQVIKIETIIDINSDVEEQDEITTTDKSNYLLSAEFLDEIPTINKPIEMTKDKTFMLTAEFLDESTTIDKPIEITKVINRKKNLLSAEYLDDKLNEISTTNKSFEIRNDMNNTNQFMLSAEFLNDEILLNENEDHSENEQSNNLAITENNQITELNEPRNKNYSCELCDRTFRSYYGLSYHMKIHNGIRKYECTHPNCSKRFISKQALINHNSVHMNAKNHLCPLCGKTYPTYDGLKYHLKSHRGERPHLCMHCGKTFIQACHLKTHMWVHNGIKPHVCKSCGNRYTSGHQLKKHMIKFCPSALHSDKNY